MRSPTPSSAGRPWTWIPFYSFSPLRPTSAGRSTPPPGRWPESASPAGSPPSPPSSSSVSPSQWSRSGRLLAFGQAFMVAIFGPAGSGKTTLAKRLAREVAPRPVLVVDPKGQWWPETETTTSIFLGAKPVRFWAEIDPDGVNVWQPQPGESDRALFRTIARGLFRLRPLQTLILDEAAWHHIGKAQAPKELLDLARYHRQLGLCLIALSQRPAGVDRDFTANARWLS